MRVAHFGTFDVDNYGDLLFPLVIEKCLGEGIEWVHVSPVGGKTGFSDAVVSISVEEFVPQAGGFDAFVVGGGNLIHDGLSAIPHYVEAGQDISAYPALWMLPALLSASRGGAVPVCWNAPGVGEAFRPGVYSAVAWTVKQLAYASVRDEVSAERITDTGAESPVEAGIDSALDMGRLWTQEERLETHTEILTSAGFGRSRETVCFHLRSWYSEATGPDELAVIIRKCADHFEAIPLLLCIGNCHGDDEFARAVAAELDGDKILLDAPPTLRHIFSAIACSRAYIGASLHGAITGYATGVKTLVVAPDGREKFDGFLSQVGGSHWRVKGWRDCVDRAGELSKAEPSLWENCHASQREKLQRQWEKLGAALRSPRSLPVVGYPEILTEVPAAWCGLINFLPEGSIGQGQWNDLVRMGFRDARLEEQRLQSVIAKKQSETSALKNKLKSGGRPAEKLRKDFEKLTSAVDSLYTSSRWKLGSLISLRGLSTRYQALDRAIEKMRSRLERR